MNPVVPASHSTPSLSSKEVPQVPSIPIEISMKLVSSPPIPEFISFANLSRAEQFLGCPSKADFHLNRNSPSKHPSVSEKTLPSPIPMQPVPPSISFVDQISAPSSLIKVNP